MAEKKTAFEMAQEYFPRLWSAERIEALYKKGLLTEEEYNKLINNKYKEAIEYVFYCEKSFDYSQG